MKRSVRAGAIAAVATLFVTFVGAEASGARAENQIEAPVAPVESAEATDGPRFYAQEVVQSLPSAENLGEPAGSLSQLVETMPETELTGDMLCLAQAIYFEARGEPIEGQLAVGQVIINRTESRHYPADYCSVVAQPAQFSFVKRGVIPRPDTGSPAWARAKAIAQIAHRALWPSEAGDALYFHATYVKPRWARRKTALARIDTHVFYR